MQKASAPKVQGFFAVPPPIGSAKAWQRRRQSRFLICSGDPSERDGCSAGLLCCATPIGSAKARQRRRQSRFLSWFAAEIHEKGRSALQGFFAGPPPIGSAKAWQRRRQSRFLSWFAAEIHEKGRAAMQGQMTIPVLCKFLWGQRSHCFLLRRNCKRRGWTPRATSASNQSAPARLQIPLMLLRYSSRSF